MRRVTNGDTIIELVLAFAIFSMCAVTTLMILNKGVAVSQRTLEKTLVRQQIDGQSEMIRYLRDTKNPVWDVIKTKTTSSPLPLAGPCPTTSSLGGSANGFFVVPNASDPNRFSVINAVSPVYSIPTTYAKVNTSTRRSAGVWVQATLAENRSGNASIRAYDFYIHGCWNSVGLQVPMTVGTIVRVYDR